MSHRDGSEAWDDARIDAAYQARFATPFPSDLAERIKSTLAPGAPATPRRWRLPVLERRLGVPLGAITAAAIVLVVAVSLPGVPPPGPASSASDGLAASRGTTTPAAIPPAASLPASTFPPTFPKTYTAAGSPYRHEVLTVSEALGLRADRERQGLIVSVGGWFSFTPVPCPARPDATSPLEDCAADFTWLMAAPEQLHEVASDGSGSIRAPIGAGFNVVLAYIEWQAPTGTSDEPIPVVFQGHFGDARAAECPAGERRARCDDLFVVDTVTWTAATADMPATLPSEVRGIPVISVPEATEVRAGGSNEELAVVGWYERPPPLRCPFQANRAVVLLDGGCEDIYTVLMLDPEQLISTTRGGMSVTSPSGPAFEVAFAAALPPPPNALPASGSSSPVHVVFVGHFHDRRAELCAPENRERCASRFVVDAVAWVDGLAPYPHPVEWRGSTDPWIQPAADPIALATAAAPGASILGTVVMPGMYVDRVEPALARAPLDLTAEPSLWLVTVLVPAGACATWAEPCSGRERPTAITAVVTADGTAYRDVGAGFARVP